MTCQNLVVERKLVLTHAFYFQWENQIKNKLEIDRKLQYNDEFQQLLLLDFKAKIWLNYRNPLKLIFWLQNKTCQTGWRHFASLDQNAKLDSQHRFYSLLIFRRFLTVKVCSTAKAGLPIYWQQVKMTTFVLNFSLLGKIWL